MSATDGRTETRRSETAVARLAVDLDSMEPDHCCLKGF
jgi:hypothetical protein